MPQVVGVKFRASTKVYYFAPGNAEGLEPGDWVIVETARGQEAGTVAFAPREVSADEIPGTLKSILRAATAVDLTQMERYQQREKQALHTCRAEVATAQLPMKIIHAEYNFSGTHLTFFFTAEKRVDFRSLVKDLARQFRTRIELRQVGVRDEVKLIGGFGLCGRPHCCATWLPEFRPISIRMAKQQNLPLSPMEISGVCGRLLCCLAFENEYYVQVRKRLPRVGRTISTPQGEGKVIGVNVIREDVTVRLPGDTIVTIPASELEPPPQPAEGGSPKQGRRRRG